MKSIVSMTNVYKTKSLCHNLVATDFMSNEDLNGQIFDLKDKFNSIEKISSETPKGTFWITLSSSKDIDEIADNIFNIVTGYIKSRISDVASEDDQNELLNVLSEKELIMDTTVLGQSLIFSF